MYLRTLLPRKLFLPLASALLFASAIGGYAATPRIVAPVDETRLTKLTGNVPPIARPQNDFGEATSSTQMTHMRLVLSRSGEQTEALKQFEFQLMDKSSPNYHKWLTPQQFGKLYGPTDSDIATIQGWLELHGFTLEPLSPGRTNIAFSGSVAQVEEAFHTSIHNFTANGETFLSNTVDPSIPSALATVVSGVAHLNTIRPRAHHTPRQLGMYDASAKRFLAVSDARSSLIHPNLSLGGGTSADPYALYVVPGDAATIYDTPNSTFNANFSSGTSYTGAGVTIGIGGDSAVSAAVVADYRTDFLGNSTQPTITYSDSVSTNGDADEAYLDMELSGGLAPGATIHFYASTDLVTAVQQAIDENTVDIFSLSFGNCELNLGTSNNVLINNWWQQAFNQGIVITVSTGDNGSASCDDPQNSSGQNVATAVGGLAVSGFASTPYNVAVGGTDYYALPGAFTTYAGAGGTSAGGTSADYFRSATKYIPESTWNDSSQTDTTINANNPFTGLDSQGNPIANIIGGSGGKSDCSTNTTSSVATGTCTSGYAKPSWQRGTGVPADSARDLPDISLLAGNGADGATWLVCTNDVESTGTINITTNCTTQSDGNFYFQGFGGTSTSTPAFAGILALVQQKTGGRLGLASKELYDLYNGAHASAIFHDVTVGNNSVSCTSGTPDCAKDMAGYYYLTGYNTTAGYDRATGLGSVDATKLITYWGSSIGSTSSNVGVTPSATSITTAQTLTVAVAVSGAAGTPTGTVTLSSGSYTSAAETLASGDYTFTIPAGTLATGTDTLTVTYSGDTTYAGATGTTQVTVTTIPAPAVSLSPASLTFASTLVGSTAATQSITVKNTGNAALTISGITLTGADASSYSQTNTCGTGLAAAASCSITVTFEPATAGTLTAAVNLADNATGSPQTVSLTGVATTPAAGVSLTPTSLTFASTLVGSTAATQVVAVKNNGNAALTISGITVTGANASSFAQTNTCATGLAVSASCSITVTFTPAASGTLTASVSIADNATGSPQTIGLTGIGATPTPTAVVSPSSLTFPSTTVGTAAATQVVTVKNTGTAALTVSGVTISGANASSFAQTNTCATVAIGATCSITVTYTPTTFGSLTATLNIADNATGSPQTVSLSGSATEAGTYALTASPAAVAPGSSTTSSVMANPSGGYTGSIAVTCAITAAPTGATDTPTCTGTTIAVTGAAATGTVTIGTTAAHTLAQPAGGVHHAEGKSTGLLGLGGAALAFVFFLGVPARRRVWKSMFGLLIFVGLMGALSGCGGSGATVTQNDPGTTAGNYTVTVTGVDAASVKETTTFTLTVN